MKVIKKIWLYFFLVAYMLLLLVYSNKQGFWHDEIYTSTFLKGSSVYNFEGGSLYDVHGVFTIDDCKKIINTDNYIDNFYLQIQHEGHPPMYFILLKVWSYIFGNSELALRSFSVVCGILFLLVLNSLFKYKSKKENVVNVLILFTLFNPFLFYFFSEARMYSLALLFAIMTFNYWLRVLADSTNKSKNYLLYVLSATALLYTHYYGIFFLTTLFFFEIMMNRVKKSMLKSLMPILLFIPWMFVIKKQLSFHSNHWTDGSYSFFESVGGFINGISELIFSPVSYPLVIEQILTTGLIVSLAVLFAKDKKGRYWIAGVVFYFLQIFLFDQLLDHHTIVIPRYYVFILIFIIWGMFKVYDRVNNVVYVITISLFMMFGANSIYKIFNIERAPKQMFREVSSYIDMNYDENNTLIVLESKGPLIFGIANYIQGNYDVVYASDYLPSDKYQNLVFLEEVLGISYLDSDHNINKKGLRLIPFVGINLFE